MYEAAIVFQCLNRSEGQLYDADRDLLAIDKFFDVYS